MCAVGLAWRPRKQPACSCCPHASSACAGRPPLPAARAAGLRRLSWTKPRRCHRLAARQPEIVRGRSGGHAGSSGAASRPGTRLFRSRCRRLSLHHLCSHVHCCLCAFQGRCCRHAPHCNERHMPRFPASARPRRRPSSPLHAGRLVPSSRSGSPCAIAGLRTRSFRAGCAAKPARWCLMLRPGPLMRACTAPPTCALRRTHMQG